MIAKPFLGTGRDVPNLQDRLLSVGPTSLT